MLVKNYIISALILFGLVIPVCAGIKGSKPDPSINQVHIFNGEINHKGRPVGFHSRPGGLDPDGAGIVGIIQKPDKQGVYVARVWIKSRKKTKISSMFPDRMTREQVIESILHAWKKRSELRGNRFRGESGYGFIIEGYLGKNDVIATAYPLYR